MNTNLEAPLQLLFDNYQKSGLVLRTDAAERFLGHAEVGGNHTERHPLEQSGLLRQKRLIALPGRCEMQRIKALLHLENPKADDFPEKGFYLVVLRGQGLQRIVVQGIKHRRFQRFNAAPVGFLRNKTDDRAGKGMRVADPVGNVFSVVVEVKGAGESALNKIHKMAGRVGPHEALSFGYFQPPELRRKRLPAAGGKRTERSDRLKEIVHDPAAGSHPGLKPEKRLGQVTDTGKKPEISGILLVERSHHSPVCEAFFPKQSTILQRVAAPRIFHLLNRWLKAYGIRLSRADIKLLMHHTEVIHLPKGRVIMPQGKPVQDLFFINSGLVRLYSKVGDTDTTIDFVPEHEFASTLIFILNQQPSVYALDTLTEVTALHWSRETVLYLREKVSAAPAIEAVLQVRLLNWIQERELDVLNLSPEARYQKLFETLPEVTRQVPLKYIASYLGITQESLSRIRRKWAHRS